MIPPILWKQGPVQEEELAPATRSYLHSISVSNPGWNVRYFSDSAAREFISQELPEPKILRAYDTLIPGAYRADLFRYCLLYLRGGLYGDLKQRYLGPLDQFVDRLNDQLVTVKDMDHDGSPGVQVSFIAAVPGLPVFRTAIDLVVDNVEQRAYGRSFLSVSGPALFWEALDRHPEVTCRMDLEQSGPEFITWARGLATTARRTRAAIQTKALPEPSVNSGQYALLWQQRAIYSDKDTQSSDRDREQSQLTTERQTIE